MFRLIVASCSQRHFFTLLIIANLLMSHSDASEVNVPETELQMQANNEELDRNYLATVMARFDALSLAAKNQEKEADELVASIPVEQIEEALRYGQEYVEEWKQLEQRIAKEDEDRFMQQGTSDKNGGTLLPTGAKYSARFSFTRHNPAAMAQSKEAAVDYVARQYLSDKLGIPVGKIGAIRFAASSNFTDRQAELPILVSCDFFSRFRTIDGSCNSRYQHRFGQAGTILQRLLGFNNYADDMALFRNSVNGQPLPSPRLISTTVIVNDTVPDPSVTLLTMQWGQFLDHDLSSTPTFTKSDGSAYECCSREQTGLNLASPPHSECSPIAIPNGDKKFDPSGTGQVTCMNFIRSTFGKDLNGNIPKKRSHVNSLTHWIDGSNVYGSDEATAQRLRDPTGNGRMKVSFNGDRQMLPLQPDCCKAPIPTGGTCTAVCFDAGDERVNEQPLLTIMHTIWVREHNRIVDNLHIVAPFQTPEFYYQHARRIVIAEMQHIIYNEYLPVMIGPDRAAQITGQESFYTGYNNPAIYTEFSTAAFRMGHSQLRSFIRLFEKSGKHSKDSYTLADSFDEPFRIHQPNFMDDALRGLLQVPAMAVDNCMADDITSQLFKPKGKTLGLDLVSLNIQRGRDHGLPPYAWMSYYLSSNYLLQSFPNKFEDLLTKMPLEAVNAIRSVYGNVLDIDLFIGGVVETPIPTAVLGPTFAGIFAVQFMNLRRTDRFFYTSNNALSANQLAEIEKISLAKIICDNSDGSITRIQPKAFRIPDDLLNKPVPCGSLAGIDFTKLLPL